MGVVLAGGLTFSMPVAGGGGGCEGRCCAWLWFSDTSSTFVWAAASLVRLQHRTGFKTAAFRILWIRMRRRGSLDMSLGEDETAVCGWRRS
jgi:hypothetical protein